jgi:NAD(P)-dependent dehydrogenase (short-subunit alcohol dehydrogenase family)
MTVNRLDGKVALITGAASGIGRIAATLFAQEGARVVLTDVADEAGEAAAGEIEASGGAAAYVHADVSSAADAEAMVAFAVKRYGSLDILYNNAGIFHARDNSVTDTPEDIWDRVIDINLKGVFLGCCYGIPAMLESGGGSIINVASFVAVMGSATSQISYTASKGGVLAMSRELGVQYARSGIRVNALCPGPVNTLLLTELFAKDPERAARRLVHVPVGRFAEPEEIAAAVAFLASDDASFITASTFLVDGGISAAYVTPL